MTPRKDPRSSYLLMSPTTVRWLALITLISLHGWFLLKLFLIEPIAALQHAVGALGLVAMLGAMVIFLSTYSFLAHAARRDLDERELMQRNEAYFRTHQYLIAGVLVGLLIMEFWERATGLKISIGQLGNFLNVLFFSGLILPATILAWKDRAQAED